jgi:hypothetical protein
MPLWTAAVVAGALLLLRRSVREAMDGNAVRVVLAAAVPAAVSLVTLPAPWPYNFLPFFVAATPVAAVALECSTAWLRRARSDRAVRFAAVVIALVAGLALVVWGIAERRRDNGPQRELVDRVLRLTAPDEPVFDGNGAYLFRPAAYPIWYHSAPMRQLLARQFEQEMASTIVAHGAPLWILDPRYESLPPPTRVFLLRHFQRYFGPLHVWGERLDGSAEPEFLAVRDGRYFLAVRPEPAEGTLRIRVDGELRAPGVPFALAAGRHPIVREAIPPATEIYLLWLPADGRLWVPGSRPDLTMYPYDF